LDTRPRIDQTATIAALSLAQPSATVALGGAASSAIPLGSVGLLRPSPDDTAARSAELERWKSRDPIGAALANEYLTAKRNIRARKTASAALVAAVNDAKGAIDKLTQQIKAVGTETDSPTESTLLNELRAAKATYRQRFDELADSKKEVEYLEGVAAQVGARLASAFQSHWLRLCGTDSRENSSNVSSSTGNGSTKSRMEALPAVVAPGKSPGRVTVQQTPLEQSELQDDAPISRSAYETAAMRSKTALTSPSRRMRP
jgi:hypothetical protein